MPIEVHLTVSCHVLGHRLQIRGHWPFWTCGNLWNFERGWWVQPQNGCHRSWSQMEHLCSYLGGGVDLKGKWIHTLSKESPVLTSLPDPPVEASFIWISNKPYLTVASPTFWKACQVPRELCRTWSSFLNCKTTVYLWWQHLQLKAHFKTLSFGPPAMDNGSMWYTWSPLCVNVCVCFFHVCTSSVHAYTHCQNSSCLWMENIHILPHLHKMLTMRITRIVGYMHPFNK